MNIHEKYINRCLELAKNGLGTTYPNPLVGSVIVHNNKIIGEGWHQKAGEAHAEVNAIRSVKEEHLLKDATIYVSLEPCSHFGKTPPCSDLIIDKGIKKVVIGTIDPFAKVAGKGVKKLMAAGCQVMVGVLENECNRLNKRFFTFHNQNRPYVILKWAKSADGFIAPISKNERQPVWISNQYSRQLVHKWRTEEQSILVGTNTAILDNPQLDARLYKGTNPVRIVIDRAHKIPKDSCLLDKSIRTIVICETSPPPNYSNIEYISIDFKTDLAKQICDVLYNLEIQSIIIEGGSKTIQTFINANLWDEARIFTGNAHLYDGIKTPEISGKLISNENIFEDNLKIYLND